MAAIVNDLWLALGGVRRRPLFALSVAGTLALGIGATATIFSVLYGILLRPLDFAEPDRLVVVWESNPGRGHELMAAAPPNVNDWRAQSRSLAGIGFDRTQLEVVADPALTRNTHTILVSGVSGRFKVVLENEPSPDNPKTAWLACYSALAALRALAAPTRYGT